MNLYNINIKAFFFIIFIFISSINASIVNNNNNNIEKSKLLIKELSNIKETYNYFRQLSYTCASTTYSKSQIQEECNDGPSSYDRVLKYNSFSRYISAHDYHTNGLNYVTSYLLIVIRIISAIS